jgi:hypothetical protein
VRLATRAEGGGGVNVGAIIGESLSFPPLYHLPRHLSQPYHHANDQAPSQESSLSLAPLSSSSSRPETVTVTSTPTEPSSNTTHPRNNPFSLSVLPNLLHSHSHSTPNLPHPTPNSITVGYRCLKLFIHRLAVITGRQGRFNKMTESGSDRSGWYDTSGTQWDTAGWMAPWK